MNFVQAGKQSAAAMQDDDEDAKNSALIDGIRRFGLLVRELSIDLIDGINPFGEAYAILAKSLGEVRLRT